MYFCFSVEFLAAILENCMFNDYNTLLETNFRGYRIMERYLIFVDAGDQTFLLGKHGEYVTLLGEAMKFAEPYDAKLYIDKHGLEHITSVRKIQLQDTRGVTS